VAGPARARLALAAICAFVIVLGIWNAHSYPPGQGYDAPDHIAYADGLVPGGHLPQGTGEYYTPPGYYAVAGSLDWVARKAGLGEPHRAGVAVNTLFLLGTALLVFAIARALWPGRDRIALGATAFVALVPVTVKTEAMFHPETMSLFLSTLALWLCVRTFADRRYAPALGVALGAAQLVRAFALWTVVAVVIALVAGRRLRELAVVVVLAGAIAAPWYIHQREKYGGSPVFNRPTVTKPLWERRPARFYVDAGVPDVMTKPYRPHFLNLALPTTFTELWGDYFGVWAWKGVGRPSAGARHQLQLQSVVGLLPTVLAVAGLGMLLAASRRAPPRLALALVPVLGILGYLYFTVSYPTKDGDVLKSTYMLSATAGWAIAFGYALDRLGGRAWVVIGALLVACAVAELPFLVYG
jgi:Dolichyl-phosphate-mannose-protein mannosyltransferase